MVNTAPLEPRPRELRDASAPPTARVEWLRPKVRLRWGDYELDEAKFELLKRGTPVTIQPKALGVLLSLLKNRDRVVDKQELLDTLWEDVSVTEASLSHAISLVRRAVGDSPGTQHTILTIRGRGFRFVAEVGTEPRSEEPGPLRLARDLRPVVVPVPEAPSAVSTDPRSSRTIPYLFVVLHCDSPAAGGARYSLADRDEVILSGGTVRSAEPAGSLGRSCRVTLPDGHVPCDPARIVKTREGWALSGQGVRRVLRDGDFLRVGRTILWLKSFESSDRPLADCDYRGELEPPFASLLPELCLRGRELGRIARSSVPVLVSGPTGSGKERTARAIHAGSGRSGGSFVFDAGGRQSSAQRDLKAAFRAAEGGTLVIEHVERLAPEAQSILVRSLDERGPRAVRLVATSALSTEELASPERLRPDLVARIAGYRCALLPLNQRLGDLGTLLADLCSELGIAECKLDPSAVGPLLRHAWPGNVRELGHALEVASALAEGGPIGVKHLPPQLRGSRTSPAGVGALVEA